MYRSRYGYQEVGRTSAQQALLADVVMQFDLDRVAVPLIVVGERAFIGFLDAGSTGRDIEAAIRSCQTRRCPDRIAPRLAALDPANNEASAPGERQVEHSTTPSVPSRMRVPLLGEIDMAGLSLTALTVVLAAADGFNPCAMWTLVFLLGLIAGMRDRVRMWTLGIAFVAASAGVYFLFMAAWLNVLLMLGMVVWLRMALGALAIGGGIYSGGAGRDLGRNHDGGRERCIQPLVEPHRGHNPDRSGRPVAAPTRLARTGLKEYSWIF